MSNIFFCGDPHGRFDHIIQAVNQHRPAAVILLGDIQAQRPLELELAPILDQTEIWFIHGNHDTDSEADHDNLFGSTLADRNLHGRVVQVAGVRIAGLGGIFRGQVWDGGETLQYESATEFRARSGQGNRWRGGLPLRHRSTIFPDAYFQLAAKRADVLVTHEAHSAHPHGFKAIDELGRALQLQTSFHGHHHDRLDYSAEDWLGFRAFGVGLRGITDLGGKVIVEGEQDTLRLHHRKIQPK
jgi:predicted phosphodiesterase